MLSLRMPRRTSADLGEETCAVCATWPCACPPPPPSGRWELPESATCAHCGVWPCACPGPIVGDPRRPPIEICACGGVIVAERRALPHVAAAIADHHETLTHRRWRDGLPA